MKSSTEDTALVSSAPPFIIQLVLCMLSDKNVLLKKNPIWSANRSWNVTPRPYSRAVALRRQQASVLSRARSMTERLTHWEND